MTFKSSLFWAFRLLFAGTFRTKMESAPSNARKSLLAAVFCVGLSLMPLIVVLVVSGGMINGMTSRIIELSSFHIQAIQTKAKTDSAQNISALREQAHELESIEGVRATYVERTGMALASGTKARTGATIRAVEQKLFDENESFKSLFRIKEGKLAFAGAKSAVIGEELASIIGLSCGDQIRLITTRTLTNGKVVPKVASFTVTGIVSCGYQELDALWVFVPIESGFDLLSANISRIFIGVQTDDAFSRDLYTIQSNVKKLCGMQFLIYNWEQLNESRYTNFRTSKILLLFIMLLIVLVASVNVSSALVMLVMEQRKEIAVLKSIGASPSGIAASFVCAGFFTGLGGVLVGIPLGLLCGVNVNGIIQFIEKIVNGLAHFVYIISNSFSGSHREFIPTTLLNPAYYLTDIPVVLPFAEIFCIAAFALLLSVLVSLVPAIKAGKEKPLDTLRKF